MISRIRIVTTAVLAALVAVGCGQSSSADGPSVTPSATVADEPAADASPEADPGSDEPTDTETDRGTDADQESARQWEQEWAPTDPAATGGEVATWAVEILDTRPHDELAFTQGLEVHDGRLYESTGLVTESTMRTVDVDTGEVLMSVANDPNVFAEGTTVVGERILQLTWQSELAYVRDSTTLEQVGEFTYDGEGWGICYDGTRLVMSNGTPELVFRDPVTFDAVETVEVTVRGEPVDDLNELECVDGYVIANIFTQDTIVVIEPTSGEVVATIDGSALTLDAIGALGDRSRVLNGIARLDDSTFLLTGKLWPTMYRVRFVASAAG